MELQIYSLASDVGYDVLAVNILLNALKEKEKKQKTYPCPADPVVLNEKTKRRLKVEGRELRQLSRLTLVVEDDFGTNQLRMAEKTRVFDILAVQPTNESAFKNACTSMDVDVIVLNMVERLPFYIKRSLVNLAITRGIHFEILYSPAVKDSRCRQNTISNGLQLVSACKGKNIIISSGCDKAIHMRGPYDIANLGSLFGLKPQQSKDSISNSCRALLKHAESRKIAKSIVGAIKSSQLLSKDRWILQSSINDDDNKLNAEDAEPLEKRMKV